MTFELIDTFTQTAVIKVIGVGGGGGNALEHMVENQIEGVDFICANKFPIFKMINSRFTTKDSFIFLITRTNQFRITVLLPTLFS